MSQLDNNQNYSSPTPDGDLGRDPVAEAKRIYERAMEHHRAGRIEDAIKDYVQVVRLSPMSACTTVPSRSSPRDGRSSSTWRNQ